MGERHHVDGQEGDDAEEHGGRGQAAGGEPEHDRPFDVAGDVVAPAARGLGDGSVEQIGADRDLRAHAEARDEQRRHQRAAADPGQADEQPDPKAGRNQRQQGDSPAEVNHR